MTCHGINQLLQGIHQRIANSAQKATTYLESQVATMTDDYALSIIGYALQLAQSSQADPTFNRLLHDAIVKGYCILTGF